MGVAAEALDGLEHGWERMLDEARGPAIHVACSATFAMRWLVPRLPDFYRRQPAVRLRLSMTTARELRHEGADLVIAWDRGAYPAEERARAIPLGPVAFGPVCAPGHPVAVRPGALAFAARLAHEHSARAWETWEALSGRTVSCEAELRFPHTHLLIEGALSGLGVALVEGRLVREELAAGRLLAPLGFTPFAEGLAAVPTSGRASSPAAEGFVGWLRGTLGPEG